MSQVTDDAGEKTNRIAMEITRHGIRIMFNAGKKMTAKTVSTGIDTAKKAITKIPGLPGQPEHGKMSVKALQHKTNDGLHAIEVSPELIKGIQHDLKKRGVDFAIEKGKDGNTYVQIQGKDADTMKHALGQVQAKLNKPQTRQDLKTTIEANAKAKKEAKTQVKAKTQNLAVKGAKLAAPKPAPKL